MMAALSESPRHEMRMSELAAFAEGSLSRLSQVATRLERKKYINRRPDPANGRYTLATLTEEGTTSSSASLRATSPKYADSCSTS